MGFLARKHGQMAGRKSRPRFPIPVKERSIQANGLDIWYAEAGKGPTLILLHGGFVSNGPFWVDHPFGWGSYLGLFAAHFRVIAPDTRGHGRTKNPSDELRYAVFAEDLHAFIHALEIEKPLLCGFGDGAITATMLSIAHPDMPRAVVNFAGFEAFDPDPQSPARVAMRAALGGDPLATKANILWPEPPTLAQQRRIDDYEPAQGVGYVRQYYERVFELRAAPLTYSYADLARATAPTLILAGDHDHLCTVEDATRAFRALPHGALGIIPSQGHVITPAACAVAINFLRLQANKQA